MIDKEKHQSLYRELERNTKIKANWLKEALQAEVLCSYLPEEIKEMEINSVDLTFDHLTLNIIAKEDTIKTLKILGVQGLKPQVSSWSKKSFYSTGEAKLPNGLIFTVHVTGIEEPEGCKVIERRRTRTEYELVCAGAEE